MLTRYRERRRFERGMRTLEQMGRDIETMNAQVDLLKKRAQHCDELLEKDEELGH